MTELRMESLHSQDDLGTTRRCLPPTSMATIPTSPTTTTATWDMGKMMTSQPSTDTNNPFRWWANTRELCKTLTCVGLKTVC